MNSTESDTFSAIFRVSPLLSAEEAGAPPPHQQIFLPEIHLALYQRIHGFVEVAQNTGPCTVQLHVYLQPGFHSILQHTNVSWPVQR